MILLLPVAPTAGNTNISQIDRILKNTEIEFIIFIVRPEAFHVLSSFDQRCSEKREKKPSLILSKFVYTVNMLNTEEKKKKSLNGNIKNICCKWDHCIHFFQQFSYLFIFHLIQVMLKKPCQRDLGDHFQVSRN